MLPEENVFSVSEVTQHIKHVIDSYVQPLFVEGEIANMTWHSSGHMYFSLKDAEATLRAVFFRNWNKLLQFKPKDGDQVVCYGSVTVFEKSGQYQLNVSRMYSSGKGNLQKQFEELKEKLSKEGLFEKERKRALPAYPETIGVITSATGAAFQDIRNIITRRYPCRVLLYPATVQGKSAAGELIAGLEYFNKERSVDVIIIGRGGGSQEDLFCFNDEMLARAIASSSIPVVSAVGHEIDFTIADFVADLRAPTPSAAAELVVPDKTELLRFVKQAASKLRHCADIELMRFEAELTKMQAKLQGYHPREYYQKLSQRLDEAVMRFLYSKRTIELKQQQVSYLQSRMQISVARHSAAKLQVQRHALHQTQKQLDNTILTVLHQKKTQFNQLQTQLQELSPLLALQRGYALLKRGKQLIRSVNEVDLLDDLELTLSDGSLDVSVNAIHASDNLSEKKE